MRAISRAALVAGGYVAIAGAYIVLSSRFARSLARSVEQLEQIERFKGMVFVGLTGLGLFFLTYLIARRLLVDADETARAREALLRSERGALAGLFVSSIAHDANNMAMVVTATLHTVKEGRSSDADIREALADAQEAMAKLTALFKDLKELGKDRNSSKRVETNLREMVERCVKLLRGHSAMKHCQVRVDAPTPVSMPVIPVLVDQILINLLLNAADATAGRGHVEVRLRAEAGEVRLEVHDDGPGVPREAQAQLFKPFVTTKAHGTGLGLVSVRECARAHGGGVEYARSPLGGAAFTVSLPLGARA